MRRKFLFVLSGLLLSGCQYIYDGPHKPLTAPAEPFQKMGEANYSQVRPIFQSRCARCHPALSLPDWQDENSANRYAKNGVLFRRVIVDRNMPQPGSPEALAITEPERNLIGAFAQSIANPKAGALTPAPLTAEQERIQHGEYLARAADCISCHTSLNATEYSGGRRMSTPFGDLLTPNITPDRATGIVRWTFDKFYQAMHSGVGRNGELLYPAFPYPSYTKMPREDVEDIFLFLKSLKPVYRENDVNQLRFPYSIRLSLAVWRYYFTEGTFVSDPDQTEQWNRGRYLVEGPGHCSACHSPRNMMGAIEMTKEFQGATIDNWYAPNITSSVESGIGSWSVAELQQYIHKGSVPGKVTAVGPMAEIILNSLSYLTEEDALAMATYLKSRSTEAVVESEQQFSFNWERSQALYEKHCAQCHRAEGTGFEKVSPPLKGNPFVTESDPTNIVQVILFGVPPRWGYSAMPAFHQQLTDQQVTMITDYIRTAWGNQGLANTTPDLVSKIRKLRNEEN